MAGNRRHAGGMNSAMANLKRIDGEIAARQAGEATAGPMMRLSKREALERYATFRDSALGFVPSIERAKRLAATASPEELTAFSEATEHLSWPESFGQTPWETASVVGFGLRFEAEHPERLHWAHEMLDAYRQSRHAVEGERAVPDCRVQSMALYIYPSEDGQVGGQIVDHGRSVWGVAGCLDRNAVIDVATEAGYHHLRIIDVPRLEDVIEIERLRKEAEAVADCDDEQGPGTVKPTTHRPTSSVLNSYSCKIS